MVEGCGDRATQPGNESLERQVAAALAAAQRSSGDDVIEAVRREVDLDVATDLVALVREQIAADIEAAKTPVVAGVDGYAVGNATFNEGLDRAASIARRSL